MSRAHLNKDPNEVAAMFDAVAKKYDVTNDLLSLGQTRSWRKAVVAAVDPKPGQKILDLAAGTGTSTQPFYAAGADPIACDFSQGMIEVGQQRFPNLTFVQGDALALPFPDNTFDATTISFGLRNVNDVNLALREMYRVTKPGGRLVICEFSQPTWSALRTVYLEYLMKALPAVATKVSSNPDAYVYLAESIRAWPNQQKLSEQILSAGWSNCQWRNLTGGIVALHRATKPESTQVA
ncbi:MAG: demethylmenaquinone methyltransferase [Actinobacteria bacterium]|nr:demethylmenaquinone methyltransferase [Actinomycetota bacterium]NBY16023.1 demethylmenaquinone methyltransferase [Actinomycetota bacterium]